MNAQKSFMFEMAEVIDRHLRRPEPQETDTSPAKRSSRWLHWLGRQMMPNLGTLLLVALLLVAVPSLAAPLRAPLYSTSTSTISYQGRLADSGGNPLTGKYNLEFRIYDVPTGGTPLWTEMWTGANSVDISDGLFNVMLGSIDNTLASAIEGQDELYLGITVGTDSEMTPRVQLGSVPFSMQAMTVPDGSITTAKLDDTAVTTGKVTDGAVTTAKIADQATSQVVFVNSSIEVNNDTTNWEDIPDMGITVTVVGGPMWIHYHMQYRRSVAAGAGIVLRLNIDGTDIASSQAIGRVAAANTTEYVALDYFANLSPGTHTIQVRWKIATTNPTGTMTAINPRQLAVTEFKR